MPPPAAPPAKARPSVMDEFKAPKKNIDANMLAPPVAPGVEKGKKEKEERERKEAETKAAKEAEEKVKAEKEAKMKEVAKAKETELCDEFKSGKVLGKVSPSEGSERSDGRSEATAKASCNIAQ